MGQGFSPDPLLQQVVTQDRDRIEVLEGKQFVVRGAKGKPIRVDWDLPPISRSTGKKSVERVMYWKQLHKVSARAYYAYCKMHYAIDMSTKFSNINNLSESENYRFQAFQLLKFAKQTNSIFGSTLNSFPRDVQCIRMLQVFKNLDTFCYAIQDSISSPASSPSFRKGLMLSEKLCDWLFEALHRADSLLEAYFEGQSDAAR